MKKKKGKNQSKHRIKKKRIKSSGYDISAVRLELQKIMIITTTTTIIMTIKKSVCNYKLKRTFDSI